MITKKKLKTTIEELTIQLIDAKAQNDMLQDRIVWLENKANVALLNDKLNWMKTWELRDDT